MQTGVVIYEDNHLLRESIEQLITFSPDYLLLGSFSNVLKLESQVKDLKPSIILMDIEMPGGINGIDAVKKIRVFDQHLPIIMLTVFDDTTHVLNAIRAGASGYILKKHLSDRLSDAMREVLTGGAPMSPNVARMVIASMHQHTPSGENIYELTDREIEMLRALSQGFGYKMIADQYHIALDTVRAHIKNIYNKMQAHSSLEAVAKGRNAGII